MLVWSIARARAAMGGAGRVRRIVSSAMEFQRSTPFGVKGTSARDAANASALVPNGANSAAPAAAPIALRRVNPRSRTLATNVPPNLRRQASEVADRHLAIDHLARERELRPEDRVVQ